MRPVEGLEFGIWENFVEIQTTAYHLHEVFVSPAVTDAFTVHPLQALHPVAASCRFTPLWL